MSMNHDDSDTTGRSLPQGPSLSSGRVWLVRALIAPVLLWNLSAALPFVGDPAPYVPAFELEGVPGMIMVRSLGLLFLMWNVPYLPALLDPRRWGMCVSVILAQQALGLAGELWMALTLPAGHGALLATGQRFIAFDSAGLLLLLLAQRLLIPNPGRDYGSNSLA